MAKRKQKKDNTHRRQAIGALLLAISILLFTAVISFNVNDPVNLSVEGNRIGVSNWLGPFGASLSYFLMQWTLGYPIIVLPVILLLFALKAIKRDPYTTLARPVFHLILWGLMFSVYLAMPEALENAGYFKEYYPSGLIGGVIAAKLVVFLGNTGSLLTLILISLVLAVLTIRIEIGQILFSFQELIDKTGAFFNRLWVSLADYRNRRKEVRARKRLEREKIKALKKRELELAKKISPVDKPREPVIDIGQPKEKPSPPVIYDNLTGDSFDDLIEKNDNQRIADQMSDQPQSENGVDFEVEEEVQDEELNYDELVKESIARYRFPSVDFLNDPPAQELSVTREELRANADLLEMKLLDFGVKAKVVRVSAGPVITLYELQPAPGVRVSSIVALANDLALAMEARGIRVIAPIPGKAAVGIEIPNRNPQIVYLKSLIRSEKFSQSGYELPLALGKTINGESYIADLAKMPHLLIAGATGAGKSVGINTIILSLLYAVNPGKVKFLMIDPKKLELSIYRQLRKHYLIWRPDLDEEVVTKPNNAVSMLNSMTLEMERRYDLLSELGVRSIVDYNKKLLTNGKGLDPKKFKQLPYIVVVIDELADLMMIAAKEIETPIARLAQMARAVGIHLIVATQRPSVDVITGVIKANFPARIGYLVASKVDSRTVLDMNGAEQLLGNGDMLFLPQGHPKPIRMQNPFITTEEVESVIDHISRQVEMPYYSVPQPGSFRSAGADFGTGDGRDSLYEDARAIVVQHQQGSISFLQRRLKIGYSRAARLMDELEEDGIVGAADGSKPRDVLITLQELDQMK